MVWPWRSVTLGRARGLACGDAARRRPRVEGAAGIDAELRCGELVCLLGPNGAGKSTLMRTLAGLQQPLAGAVDFDGGDLHRLAEDERARLLGLVLTERVAAGNLSAYALVSLGRYPYTGWDGRLSAADEEVVRWASPVISMRRTATRDGVTLGDRTFDEGDKVGGFSGRGTGAPAPCGMPPP